MTSRRYEAHFMGVVLCCLEATNHRPEFVLKVHEQFERIAVARNDLVERYWSAHARRDASEMERLLSECNKLIRENNMLPPTESSAEDARFRITVTDIGNLRINAATGRFHVGHGSRSVALFSGPGPTQH